VELFVCILFKRLYKVTHVFKWQPHIWSPNSAAMNHETGLQGCHFKLEYF